MIRLQHARVSLTLHAMGRREGPALLLLHALYGASTDWGDAPAAWPGRVYALDFCGHGQSETLAGGAYHPELLVADADAALAHIGPAAVAGTGLGAYVALLLAGSRPLQVPAALLLPGAGLEGGGDLPDFAEPFPDFLTAGPHGAAAAGCDPLVRLLDLSVRPAAYTAAFAQAAQRLLLAEDGAPRPPWWVAIRQTACARAVTVDVPAALAALAAAG